MMRPPQDDEDVSPAERLDEAFAQLRALPVSAFVWCVVGPVPMVLALLFGWADLTDGGVPGLGVAWWAAVLTAGWVWLKVTQAFFARAVWGCLLPVGGLPALSPGGWFRRTGALLAVTAWAVPALALAALTVVPFGWVFGFFHQATALAYTHDLGGRPWRELVRASAHLTHRELWAQHLSLVMLAVLAVLVWASVFGLGLMVPYLVSVLTGVESEFTRSPLAVAVSPLYLSLTVSLSWMIFSPYGRVVHVLRAFHGLSRRTGDDVLGRLQALRSRVSGGAAVVCFLILMGVGGGALRAEPPAVETPGPAREVPAAVAADPVDTARLSQAIRDTLAQREYQWRGPGAGEAGGETATHGPLAAVKDALRSVRDGLRTLDRWLSDASRRLRQLLGRSPGGAPSGEGGGLEGDALRAFLVVGGVLVVGGGLGLAVRAWHRRRRVVGSVGAGGAAAPAVDLAGEGTLASALPEDAWLQMARVQREAGDLRLAVRAVFLATVAAMGERRLIEIGRGKSNRDYVEELRRRAVGRSDVPEVFGRSVAVFERVWYGRHDVAPEWVSEVYENHQQLTRSVPTA